MDLRCFAHWVCGCANCVSEMKNKTKQSTLCLSNREKLYHKAMSYCMLRLKSPSYFRCRTVQWNEGYRSIIQYTIRYIKLLSLLYYNLLCYTHHLIHLCGYQHISCKWLSLHIGYLNENMVISALHHLITVCIDSALAFTQSNSETYYLNISLHNHLCLSRPSTHSHTHTNVLCKEATTSLRSLISKHSLNTKVYWLFHSLYWPSIGSLHACQ